MPREHSQSLFEWEFTSGYSGVGGVCTADFLPRSCSRVQCGRFGPKNRCLLSRVPGSTFPREFSYFTVYLSATIKPNIDTIPVLEPEGK